MPCLLKRLAQQAENVWHIQTSTAELSHKERWLPGLEAVIEAGIQFVQKTGEDPFCWKETMCKCICNDLQYLKEIYIYIQTYSLENFV